MTIEVFVVFSFGVVEELARFLELPAIGLVAPPRACGREARRVEPELARRCFFAFCARLAFAPFAPFARAAPASVDAPVPPAIAAV